MAVCSALVVTGCAGLEATGTGGGEPSDPTSQSSAVADDPLLPEWARETLADNEYLADLNPYVATVVGYGDPDSYTNKDNINWIELSWTRQWIDRYSDANEVLSEPASGAVKLDMVMPYEPAVCGSKDPEAARKAREALEKILPIGSTVLAIRGGSSAQEEDRFLHVLTDPTASPSPAPPAGSVNEALVSSGTWVPDEYGYYFDDRPYDTTSVLIVGPKFRAPKPITEYDPERVYFETDDYGRSYSDRIIAAANTALTSTPEGQECRKAYNAYVKREVKESKRNERERNAWLLKMERERQSWSCRDGDGDGICFER